MKKLALLLTLFAATSAHAELKKVFENIRGTVVFVGVAITAKLLAALCLLARNPGVRVTGVEIATRYAMICEENARRNAMQGRLRVIHADVREALRRDQVGMPAPGSFAHAMMNPPFFDAAKSTPSPDATPRRRAI